MAVLALLLGVPRSEAISYQVGFIDGTVLTSTGAPVPNVQINAISLTSSGVVTTWLQPNGTYHLEVPTGDYRVEARYEYGTLIGTQPVAVAADQSSAASFTFLGGHLQTTVLRDLEPAAGAWANIREAPPSSCAIAESCSYTDPNDPNRCYGCRVGTRTFDCWAAGACNWWSSAYFTAYANANGVIDKLLPVGDYVVDVYSAYEPNQWGQFRVGQASGTITDGAVVNAGEVGYATAYVTGTVTRNGQPYPGVRITADNQMGSAETYTGTGTYRLRLPLGNYNVTARDNSYVVVGQAAVSLTTALESVTQDFAVVDEGTVTGRLTRDGTAARSAWIYMREAGPASCAVADSCGWTDPNDPNRCYSCRAGTRQFDCYGAGQCNWWNPLNYTTYTSWNDGSYSLTAKSGNYTIDLYSGYEEGQWGQLLIARESVSIAAGSVLDHGETSYQTGRIGGAITNCSAPATNVRVSAQSTNGSVETWVGAGSYSLRVPVGTYNAVATWSYVVPFGSASVAVTAGATTPFDANGTNGNLIGEILRNGLPATGARAYIREQPPSSCAIADTCGWSDPNDPNRCYTCQVGTRRFDCWSAGNCYWWNAQSFYAYTGADGTFRTELPPGAFIVDAYSANVSGQYGEVLVGSVNATVNACSLSEVGASGSIAQPGTNVFVQLNDSVSLTFDQVTAAGEVSFVATSTPQGGSPPSSTIEFMGLYYDFIVDATFVGSVTMCLPYDPAQVQGNPNNLNIYHWENNKWVKLTTTADTVNNLVCAPTTSFSWYVVGETLNSPPTAEAGADFEVTVGDNCLAAAPLDGSRSSDPEGVSDIVSYQWSLGATSLGSGTMLTTQLSPGTYTLKLVVTDSTGATSSDTVQVVVVDRTAPSLQVSLDQSVLWPPDGKMKLITPTITATDNCTASPTVRLDRVISLAAAASDIDTTSGINVRATRKGTEQDGRVYEIIHTATDDAGNATTVTSTVTVPHDQGN